MNYRVTVRTPGSDVEAWSSVRLPFEPKGWLLDFRRELAHACRELKAAPRQVLHAVYTSADRRLVDVENVLTYNLGTAAIRAAAQHGLILERAYSPVHDGGHQHHYRYRLPDRGQRWSRWSAGQPLASIGFAAPAEAFRAPTAGRWWLAARRASLTAHAQTTRVPDRLALRVYVSPPERWRGSLANLVKPLTDGLVAAMHAHEGPVDPVLGRAPTIDPDLTRDEFRALLLEPTRAPSAESVSSSHGAPLSSGSPPTTESWRSTSDSRPTESQEPSQQKRRWPSPRSLCASPEHPCGGVQ